MRDEEARMTNDESAPEVGEGGSVPLPLVAAKARRSVYHVAAIFSLWAPLIAGVLMAVVDRMGVQAWVFVANVVQLGMLAGLFALLGIRRYGTQRLLMRALVGIVMGVVIMDVLAAIVAQRSRAAKAEEERIGN